MAREIERKFLLGSDGWRDQVGEVKRLKQFYLFAREDASLRVRVIEERSAWLTLKTGTGIDRGEFEYEIPLKDAEEMQPDRIGNIIEKTRHIVSLGARKVEIDIFEGDLAGLALAEIELESADEAIDLPSFLSHEITGDPRYSNMRLALDGRPADDDGRDA
ncbi:CYTH domain-containing protein [Aurantimonas sp. VKM B-3413]|uniref:CYTH domain-containing protein n=1 Tax=Aurantimonas sp. VKM B-3413 TaxID=2779401 RepID=UPI001E32DFE4|nr:CYTH domain-containing protein [Aurantimonas sp. VKM B-3413]MCB8836747.1 CYTH domain-containing protein [Aurantimonas sp. VKM B-3413]